ncbi:cytochrome P450 [Melanomma pulvis-pyrius CBS 109.77]|uniref:Cytochrome P450 n=1 Tax=Melanomma pulvis-pyrius CBS 109.77 TaxID=1314802 RepID=A0A6A6XPC3_9PLEO|nr:cytochrome P450 [Melanomma pulvis-pyrius CBS 109.77]
MDALGSPAIGVLVVAPISAILLHEAILKRVEVDHLTLHLLATSTAVYWLTVYYAGLFFATLVATAFLVPLCLCIILYRAFFHPLKAFPGPFGARISKWWTVKQVWDTNWHWYRVQQGMHAKYGDYVRTGPRELAIFDPAAIQPLLGFKSPTTKGPFYDVMETSLHLNRDKVFHRQRRKIWDNAMKESLSDYAPHVEDFTSQLLKRLREADGKPVPLLDYCSFYSYDVMADLAFGKPMGFVKGESSQVAENVLRTLTDGLNALGILYHIPWFMNAIGILTSLAGPLKEWTDWSQQQMKERMAVKDARPDFTGHLISNTARGPKGDSLLYGDSRLIISAGAETTSTSLTFIFMHLAVHQHYLRAIRKEYRESESSYSCERSSPLLDAVIYESMRLWPSVFLASQRIAPPQGMTISGHYIPGNTIITIPPFPLNRDPRNFEQPDFFIPERWTTRPELVANKSAFLPFSTGPYNCAGKGLAMMEMRSVISRVVNEFDILLPEGFDQDVYFGGIKDRLTAGPPNQFVSFQKAK